MQLLDIHEPGQTPEPHSKEEAIGIDLGTTHSLVACVRDDKPQVIPDALGQPLTPSVVAYTEDKVITVGTLARDYIGQAGCYVISSIKRLMGRGIKDIRKISGTLPFDVVPSETDEAMVRLQVGNQQLTPVEISAEILRSLKKQAENALEKDIAKAVITVPAYFDDAARQATKDAAKLAGLEVLRLVNEPTAAALAYGLDTGAEGIYAIYDLGGGTFDISLLKMEKGVFQVLATGGDAALGGDDFDHEVAELFLWHYKKTHHKIPKLTADELKPILVVARQAKEYLSDHEEGVFNVIIEGVDLAISLTKEQLNTAINAFVNKTIDIADLVMDDADISPESISGVVLVGGSTRVPLVKEKVTEFFGKLPLDNVNPDEVVALGAAMQADSLTHGSDNVLLDVLPLSLGMETMGGIVEKVIHRNTPIPTAAAQEFTTYQDGQTGMKFHVVQGEREMAVQCRSLARFELKGIPSMTAGAARIRVKFSVDADGLLAVEAEETTTGIKQEVQVKPSYGLEVKEIEQMLLESMRYAKEDMALRLLTETCIETERSIVALQEAFDVDGDLLSAQEREVIDKQMAITQKAIAARNRDIILVEAGMLERHAERFAAKRMDKHIGKALQGKAVDNIEEKLST